MNSNYQINDNLAFFAEVLFSNVESKRALAYEPLAPLAFFGVQLHIQKITITTLLMVQNLMLTEMVVLIW